MTNDERSIQQLIDERIREMLLEMSDRPPRDREALAGAVERLMKAKPLAGDGGLNLLEYLKQADSGPKRP